MAVVGLVLAAGAGRRMGTPKGLLTDPDGIPWVARRVQTLVDGGCSPVVVVLGAAADQVAQLVPPFISCVVAPGWAEGMGASLRAGLAAVEQLSGDVDAVLVGLVDTPGVTVAVVTRLIAQLDQRGDAETAGRGALMRAAYDGVPGHPVVIGRDHWAGVAASASGDAGARAYLKEHRGDVVLVECGDIGSGHDVDTPADLAV